MLYSLVQLGEDGRVVAFGRDLRTVLGAGLQDATASNRWNTTTRASVTSKRDRVLFQNGI